MMAKKKSSFPYKTLVFLLTFAVGSLIVYDVKREGCWMRSKTFKYMEYVGIFNYLEHGKVISKEGFARVHKYIDERYPGYVDEANKVLEPYVLLANDVALILRNNFYNLMDLIVEKSPMVIQSVSC